jgi:hypothetical protein
VTRVEQERLILDASREICACQQRTITVQYNTIQALGLLGTLQLALRHPRLEGPTSRYMRELATHLEMFLAECGPATKRLCACGWNPEDDAPSDEGGHDNG